MLPVAVALFLCLPVSTAVSEFYMDELCGETLSLYTQPANAISLRLTSSHEYDVNMNCELKVLSDVGTYIVTTFVMLDINSYKQCPGDFVQIEDTDETAYNVDSNRFCGKITPGVTVVSSTNNVTVRFVSDGNFHGQGFHLILTQFHRGACSSDEFTCDNGRCIHGDLQCDESEHDNCGDFSDRCRLSMDVTIGIVIGCFLLLIVIVILAVIVWYRLRLSKEDDGFVQDARSVSDATMISVTEPPPMSGSTVHIISEFLASWQPPIPAPPTNHSNSYWAAVVPPLQSSTPTPTPPAQRAATRDRDTSEWSSPLKSTSA